MKTALNSQSLSILLSLLAAISFFYGFIFDEISMGAGGYEGDFQYVKKSIFLFSENSTLESIKLFSDTSNRPPLIYILHKLLNPFFTDLQSFRKVVFGISLMIPFLFYLCLRERFEKTSKSLLLLLSSVTFFNPFIRTSSFWGLEENYAIISSLAAILFLLRFIKNGNENFLISFKSIFFVTFFSSLSIYFDQKFIIIPILCFYKIIFSYFSLRTKLTTIFCYSLFSIPYILLIKLWGGIFPTDIYEVGSKFYYNNLGYAFTIVSFIFFPFIFLKSQTIINQILVFLKERNIIILLIPITIYLIFIFFFHNDDFFSNEYDGGGIIKKISLILFSSALYQKIFIFFSFLISWFFIFFFIEKKLFNLFIVLFFLILSFTVSPFYQEYFDPIIFILIFLVFNLDLKLSYKRVYFFYFYFLLFLIGTNAYYN